MVRDVEKGCGEGGVLLKAGHGKGGGSGGRGGRDKEQLKWDV